MLWSSVPDPDLQQEGESLEAKLGRLLGEDSVEDVLNSLYHTGVWSGKVPQAAATIPSLSAEFVSSTDKSGARCLAAMPYACATVHSARSAPCMLYALPLLLQHTHPSPPTRRTL